MVTNETAFDEYTAGHFAVGFFAGFLGVRFWFYIFTSAVYEAIEFSMESPNGNPIFGTKRPESPVNVATDLAVGLFGYGVGLVMRRAYVD